MNPSNPDTAPALPAERNGATADTIHAQRARIVAWLRVSGRTSCAALASACDVPSVTKRVCELIGAGWPIERTRGRVRDRCGGPRRATFYELTGPHAQRDLFTDPTP